ncbi:hypothetical protein [Arthrobacter sp. HMWF013]|nr:hypothetical protein [Arthrobacter sp. HMWF013]
MTWIVVLFLVAHGAVISLVLTVTLHTRSIRSARVRSSARDS